ncbi:MAG: acyl-CoA ligase (AMP-forming), exosortase A system-associated [Planctomycetota bacterium]|jgi:acyl-CoA ligase (AMP-forming) (exosortase A-associated)
MAYLLHHLLENAATARPDHEAVVDRDRRLDYRGFLAAAETCAAVLREHGLERGDRAATFLDKSLEECAAIFGISRAGGVFVPVNALLRSKQVAHILNDCGVRFLITNAQRLALLQDVLHEISTLEAILLVDDGGEGARCVPNAFDEPRPAPDALPCVGEELAAILYTSGSTGRPKGVMLSHRNLLAGSRIVCEYLRIGLDERILSVLPFSFDVGLNQLITAVEKAATTILLTFRFGDEIVRAIRNENATALAGVPTVWAVLAGAAPSFRKEKLETLRYFTNTGGPVPTETLSKIRQAQPHVEFVLMYGLTEAFRSTYLPPEQIDLRPTSMGKAIPETEIFLVGENGERCGPGEEGILVHRGPTVSLGYWNRPEDTDRVLRPHPFIPAEQGGERVCYSGDKVRMDEEGYFFFVGRADAMIKSSGFRISPSEVEEVLMSSGVLAQAAVIGLPDPAIGERVHAVCVVAEGRETDAATLLAHCATELPQHMLPREVEFIPELPRSPNGKVDYKGLKAARVERVAGP